MIGRLARAIRIVGYIAANAALELLDEGERPDVVRIPEAPPRPPPNLREMAAHPLAASVITKAVDLLVDDDLIVPALTLVYLESALLSPYPDGLRVAMRNDQLLIPGDAVAAFAESLQAALEARDGHLLAEAMRTEVDVAWDYELRPREYENETPACDR